MADYQKHKGYTRDTKGDDHRGSQKDAVVSKEVRALIRGDSNDFSVLNKLRAKYGNNEQLVDKIFDAYKERQRFIMKKARKFKNLIYDRYSSKNLPFHELLKKAKKYAKKYGLSDEEFQLYVNLALTDKENMTNVYNLPNTKMSKTLGYAAVLAASDRLRVKESELNIVRDILTLHGQTKPLHAQVLIQSLLYRDTAAEAISGEFNPTKHNAFNHIHPIIAAMFLPRIKFLDEHMLIANIGTIVKAKHDGLPLSTKPDFELYWDLIVDPNDHVCNIKSPIKDLHNRFILQTRIWDSVLNLRQGKYYNEKMHDFLVAVDNCRTSIYDAPDLTYVRDEGSILRRILAAFSIRPSIVITTRLFGVLGGTGYGIGSNPISAAGVRQVTTVPMVTLRLPVSLANRPRAVHLEESLQQPQWYIENKMLIPKAQQLVHSREVLFFYVNRRFQTINITKMSMPFNFNALPMTVSGYERMNDTIVNFDRHMNIMGDLYDLRSVVFVEHARGRKNLIIGCSAGIVVKRQMGRYQETFMLYDPLGVAEKFRNVAGNYVRQPAIAEIPAVAPLRRNADVPDSFMDKAHTQGTIFMYEKVREGTNPFFRA